MFIILNLIKEKMEQSYIPLSNQTKRPPDAIQNQIIRVPEIIPAKKLLSGVLFYFNECFAVTRDAVRCYPLNNYFINTGFIRTVKINHCSA